MAEPGAGSPHTDAAAMLLALQASAPQAMRDRAQWLLWRFEAAPGEAKPRKVPYYVSGRRRKGTVGSVEDRAALKSFDVAIGHLAGGRYEGLGFAFLPGDGLIGVDIDGAIDPATGEVSALCQQAIDACASYTELSPSGKGVHIIVQGECETTKDNGIGLEVFCGRQYFTFTGRRWPGSVDQVQPIAPEALAWLVDTVAQAKEAARAAAKAARPVKDRPVRAAPSAAPLPDGPSDFARVNAAALQQLDGWVPALLPAARPSGTGGWRVTSKDLGRKLQEDLSLHPDGIQDFGAERGMTPIDVVVEFGGMSAKDALAWLASAIGFALQPRRLRAVPSAGAAVGDGGADATDSSVPPDGWDENPPPEDEGPAAPSRGQGKPPRKVHSAETWGKVEAFHERYALVYGSDTAWDAHTQMLVRVPAMRLAWGKDAVNLWLASERRRMVLPTDLVFEPGADVQWPQINMFNGLDVQPVPCTADEVAPMLALLRHLCAESADSADDIDAIVHWILCWQALPLQRMGTKMQTACVFHGAQGTGKNLYWDIWRDLFGVYGITVGQTELEDKFNGWVSRKLAIIGDEVVSRQEMYHNKNRLKLVVTQQDKFPIRGMLQETRWESNHANVVFLSNESQPLALEERDRRYMVIYTPLEAREDVYDAVRRFRDAGGAGKWLHYLQTYPLEGFGAHTKPLLTRAKVDLIEAAWKAAPRFGHEWLEGVIELPMRVCSAEQLFKAFRRWCEDRGERWPPSQAGFTAELKRWLHERVQRDPVSGRYAEPALTYKVVALKDDTGQRRSVRCWLPAGTAPPNGVTEGEWAFDSVRTFERDVWKFCRRRGSDEDEAA